jgi:hypothetical protein
MTTKNNIRQPRELDHRAGDGIEVRLLWHEHDDSLQVAVADAKTGDAFVIDIRRRDRARHVFEHPYAYSPTQRPIPAMAA